MRYHNTRGSWKEKKYWTVDTCAKKGKKNRKENYEWPRKRQIGHVKVHSFRAELRTWFGTTKWWTIWYSENDWNDRNSFENNTDTSSSKQHHSYERFSAGSDKFTTTTGKNPDPVFLGSKMDYEKKIGKWNVAIILAKNSWTLCRKLHVRTNDRVSNHMGRGVLAKITFSKQWRPANRIKTSWGYLNGEH